MRRPIPLDDGHHLDPWDANPAGVRGIRSKGFQAGMTRQPPTAPAAALSLDRSAGREQGGRMRTRVSIPGGKAPRSGGVPQPWGQSKHPGPGVGDSHLLQGREWLRIKALTGSDEERPTRYEVVQGPGVPPGCIHSPPPGSDRSGKESRHIRTKASVKWADQTFP